MDRRDFLRSAGIVTAGLAWPGSRPSFAESPAPAGWRTFELVTRAEVLDPSGPTRVWIPLPLAAATPYQKAATSTFKAEGGTAKLVPGTTLDSVAFVAADFPAGVRPVLTVTSRASTRNYDVDLVPGKVATRIAPPSVISSVRQAATIESRSRPGVIAGAARTDEAKPARSTSGSSRTPSAIPRCTAAARHRSMLETGAWAENARTSMRCTSRWPRFGASAATCTASTP